jgi:uncharacterized protein YjiK
VFFVSGAPAAEQAVRASVAPVRQAQVLDVEGTGVTAPLGLAFAARSETFYVLGAPSSGSASAGTDVVMLTSLESASASSRLGSSHIATAIQDPINIAFDAYRSRMLFMSNAGELLEAPVGADGQLGTVEPKRHDAALFGPDAPNGMAVDPASGVVFIADANVPRIVRVEPQSGGSFDNAMTSELDLGPSGIGGVTGLAFDPSTGHLQLRDGESLYELTTAGEVVAVRDLAGLDLATPEGMVIAPSTDQTDDPSTTSVYVADSGGGATQASGKIVELSLAPLATTAAIDFTSQLVRTVDMGALSPPSPDPSGITHVPGTGLVVADAEVEETVNGITHFQGANIWELSLSGAVQRTANISNVPPTVAPVTNEPAGIAFNPSNGHYFVSADDTKRIFDINPGADGLLGTADDSSTFFNTTALNQDPEGIAYSTFSGNLFVADGVNREVFQYSTGGALVGNFDVLQYGINDPNSVEFNTDSGTLFVLSDRNSGTGNQRLIAETTTSGALVRTIDVGASNSFRPDGVAYAPASDGTGAKRFYIVDRVLDNNLDPNAVDGKLYEMTAPAPSTATPTFADVPPSNPHYEDIEHLYALGITQGCGTNGSGQLLFCPTAFVPREQMAAFLVRAKGLTQLFPATPTFADVPASSIFFGYVERLFQQGITQGCGTSGGQLLFCPKAFVPREQMAAFLIRAKGLTQLFPGTPTFADVPPSNIFFGYVERLYEQGITQGCGTSGGQLLFCPTAFVPREQMASFLIRAFA